jgi:hypothetical protein
MRGIVAGNLVVVDRPPRVLAMATVPGCPFVQPVNECNRDNEMVRLASQPVMIRIGKKPQYYPEEELQILRIM